MASTLNYANTLSPKTARSVLVPPDATDVPAAVMEANKPIRGPVPGRGPGHAPLVRRVKRPWTGMSESVIVKARDEKHLWAPAPTHADQVQPDDRMPVDNGDPAAIATPLVLWKILRPAAKLGR